MTKEWKDSLVVGDQVAYYQQVGWGSDKIVRISTILRITPRRTKFELSSGSTVGPDNIMEVTQEHRDAVARRRMLNYLTSVTSPLLSLEVAELRKVVSLVKSFKGEGPDAF